MIGLSLLHRAASRAALILSRVRVRMAAALFGRQFVLDRMAFHAPRVRADWLLRLLGAMVGPGAGIEPDVRIQNAAGGHCANLTIGRHVYIGPRCLFDLASKVSIGDEAALSAGVTVITHRDVGARPLRARFPRREGAVVVGAGAWLGANVTVLDGVVIGERAVVGACSLVNKNLPPDSVSMGTPAKVVRVFPPAPEAPAPPAARTDAQASGGS